VNEAPERRDIAAARAEQELVRLNGQVQAMRAVLIQLLQDVVRAESRLDSNQAAQLLEANERLVLSSLNAQSDAVTAAGALDEASRLGGLDPLTGLPNRAVLLDRLALAIASARRHGNRVALLFLDINNFKLINDTFGHAAGDMAIQLVADCLFTLVRESDTVSRHGGDEFLILLAEISQAADAAVIAEKVSAALAACSRIDGHAVRLTASIGISIYPEDGDDAKTLIDRADAAMYVAKSRESGGFVFHADQPAGQAALTAPSIQSQARRLTHYQLTMAEYERTHAQLQEANEHLVLAALGAQELQAAAEDAKRRQMGLLADIARELSNPFAPIRIAAAMLGRQDADKALLPRAQAIVDQQVNQLSRLADGLLSPGPDRDSLKRGHRPFDVVATVGDAARACQASMDRRLQALAVDIPATPIEVNGDPALIAQVLDNLLSNANAYSPNGGQIRLSVVRVNREVLITVADNGAGIAPEALVTIFDPFVRDPLASAVNEDGLGIGLTVVRAIVEAHAGRVVATSAGVGRGSEFVVSLPVAG
jgi:diguanylate cyclase (GGDEF)-like protein